MKPALLVLCLATGCGTAATPGQDAGLADAGASDGAPDAGLDVGAICASPPACSNFMPGVWHAAGLCFEALTDQLRANCQGIEVVPRASDATGTLRLGQSDFDADFSLGYQLEVSRPDSCGQPFSCLAFGMALNSSTSTASCEESNSGCRCDVTVAWTERGTGTTTGGPNDVTFTQEGEWHACAMSEILVLRREPRGLGPDVVMIRSSQ